MRLDIVFTSRTVPGDDDHFFSTQNRCWALGNACIVTLLVSQSITLGHPLRLARRTWCSRNLRDRKNCHPSRIQDSSRSSYSLSDTRKSLPRSTKGQFITFCQSECDIQTSIVRWRVNLIPQEEIKLHFYKFSPFSPLTRQNRWSAWNFWFTWIFSNFTMVLANTKLFYCFN